LSSPRRAALIASIVSAFGMTGSKGSAFSATTLFSISLTVNILGKNIKAKLAKEEKEILDSFEKAEWICFVIEHPEKTVIQSDGRIKKWPHIQDAGKTLRVILLEDGETVHNAFFDRSYKEI